MNIRQLNKEIEKIIAAAYGVQPQYFARFNDIRQGFRRRVWKYLPESIARKVLDEVNKIDPGWMLYKDLTVKGNHEQVMGYGIKKYTEI